MAGCAMVSQAADPGISLPDADQGFADTDEKLGWVQHALRTPLTSIRAFAEILLDNPQLTRADQRAFLKLILGESERLADAVGWVGSVIGADSPPRQEDGADDAGSPDSSGPSR